MFTTILTTFLFLILETLNWQEVATGVASVVFALWLWKSGIPQQLFSSTNNLLTIRTTERDDALRDRDRYKAECETLDREMKALRREIVQRIEIHLIDQEEIRELKQNNG